MDTTTNNSGVQNPAGGGNLPVVNPNAASQGINSGPVGTPISPAIPVDTLNNLSTTPTTPPQLPPPAAAPDYNSIIAGTQPITAPTPENPTPATTGSTGILNSIKSLMGIDTGKAAYTSQVNAEPGGVNDLTAKQNDLTAKLNALNDQAQKIPIQDQANATGRGVTVAGNAPIDSANLRNNALQALTYKIQYDMNAGDLATAQQNATNAINLKYGDLEAAITNQTNLLKLYEPFMSTEQANAAAAQNQKNAAAATALADSKKQLSDFVSSAITNGDATTASKALALDPSSPTFTQDLSKVASGLVTANKYQVVKGGTDAFGNPLPDQIFDSTTGKMISGGNGGSVVSTTATNGVPIIGSGGTGTGTSKLSFDQYGLLANTNFSPTNMVDNLSQKYLDQYIKNGTVPTASSLGRNMKPEAMAQVDSRARDLYFKATGTALPSPQIIKGYQDLINNNNKLANNLSIQEQTVKQNVDLSIVNMKANDLNSSNFQPLNNLINTVGEMFSDPHIGQLIAQNTTIQSELGSLLAVKNASGTTVFDKMASAGIINKNDPQSVITSKVNALMQEATNFAGSLANANASIYKQVDPFLQDPNNPARAAMKVDKVLTDMNSKLPTPMKPQELYNAIIARTPHIDPKDSSSLLMIPVIQNSDNSIHYVTPDQYNNTYYTKL